MSLPVRMIQRDAVFPWQPVRQSHLQVHSDMSSTCLSLLKKIKQPFPDRLLSARGLKNSFATDPTDDLSPCIIMNVTQVQVYQIHGSLLLLIVTAHCYGISR